MTEKKLGLAAASKKTIQQVASLGGQAVSRDRAHMAAIGRKGGLAISKDKAHMSELGRRGGKANRK